MTESNRVEYKRELGDGLATEVVAFLNYHDGGVIYGVEEEDFFTGFSVPHNKELMRAFRDLEIVAQLGSGVPRILTAYGQQAIELRKRFVRVTMHYARSLSKEEGVETGVESERILQVMSLFAASPLSKTEIGRAMGKKRLTRYLNDLMKRLLDGDWLLTPFQANLRAAYRNIDLWSQARNCWPGPG